MSADKPALVLASASPARAGILSRAGVPALIDPARIDEDEAKHSLKGEGADAVAVADTLAELKALHVARRHPGAFVIGADQVLECGGVLFDKPADRAHARAHLAALSGRRHRLVSAICVVQDERRLWHHIGEATLTMRQLGDGFVERYLDAAGDAVLDSVGAYQIEGLGAQLFTAVEGDYFTILGLPLLPLLDFLRNHGIVDR